MVNMSNSKICIIGLGYVGLPLAAAFSSKYQVVGLDIYQTRIDELSRAYDRTLELNEAQLQEAIDNNIKLLLTSRCLFATSLYIHLIQISRLIRFSLFERF